MGPIAPYKIRINARWSGFINVVYVYAEQGVYMCVCVCLEFCQWDVI